MSNELISLQREGDVFVLEMVADENRWNTTFTRAFDAALDEVEAAEGRIALVTASASEKFFSNGLDLEWISSKGDHPGGDRQVFGAEAMALFARLMTLPIPTVCAVNGHGFGAGFMIALCHDVRVMNAERGYLCANEMEIGIAIPEPELALFRHKMSMPAFFQTVQLAKRWTGTEAFAAGIVQHLAPPAEVREMAVGVAHDLLRVAGDRAMFGWMKETIYGENAAINGVHGPAYMLRNMHDYSHGPAKAGRQLPGHVADPVAEISDTIDIAAPPDKVWALVTAMDRYGEWSNENTGGRWRKREDGEPGTGEVGDFFVGVNVRDGEEWKAPVEIIHRVENQDFAFVTGGLDYNIALWRYRLAATDRGTRLTESWTLRKLSPRMIDNGQPEIDYRTDNARTSIRATLEGLKAAAEA